MAVVLKMVTSPQKVSKRRFLGCGLILPFCTLLRFLLYAAKDVIVERLVFERGTVLVGFALLGRQFAELASYGVVITRDFVILCIAFPCVFA